MSTGLCLGANSCGVKLVTVSLVLFTFMDKCVLSKKMLQISWIDLLYFNEQKWAVDLNPYACESLKLNHPETQVIISKRISEFYDVSTLIFYFYSSCYNR